MSRRLPDAAADQEFRSSMNGVELNAPPRPTLRQWLLVLFVVAATALGCRWQLLAVRAAPAWDADWFFAPQHIHLANQARAGKLLLWDPWTNAGTPSCVYTEIGTFSPLTLLCGLATGPTLRGYMIYWLVIWLLGGVGMLFLARHLGAPTWGGAAAALGFLFCGFFNEHAQQTSWQYSYAALPWIIWRFDAAILRRRILPAVQSGTVWGLSFMAGYPGVVLATGMTTALWVVGRVVCRAGPRLRELWRVAWLLLLWGAVGAVVMSPTLLAFQRETPGYSDRSQAVAREQALRWNYLHPHGLLSLATPYSPPWLGLVLQWPTFDPGISANVYIGLISTWLALAALLMRPKDAWRWWLAAIGALGIGLAVGPLLPLRGWLYDYFPPSRYFKHASIFETLSMFAAFVLAATAAADMHQARGADALRLRRRLAAAALLAGAAGALGCWLAVRVPGHEAVMPLSRVLPGYIGWGAVAAVGLIALVAHSRPLWRRCLVAAIVALAMADAVYTSWQSAMLLVNPTPFVVAEWKDRVRSQERRLDLAAISGLDRRLEGQSTLWSPAGMKHLFPKTPMLNAGCSLNLGFHQAWVATPVLRDAAIGPRRIWFSPTAVEVPWNAHTFHHFVVRSQTLGVPPLVVHRPDELTRPQAADAAQIEAALCKVGSAPAAARIDAALIEYRPDRLALRVECPSDGWLLVTDRWAPGWTAVVNDQPATVYGGMFIFRAVRVTAGANEVRFTYKPWGHPWLMIVSYATMGIVLAASLRRRGQCSA